VSTVKSPAGTTRPVPVTADQISRMTAVGTVTVVIALTTALVAAAGSGAVAASLLNDPGALVRWGLVAVRVIADLSAAVTVGVLVLAALALPVTKGDQAHRPALLLAAGSSTIWAAAEIVLLVFSLANELGTPLGGSQFGTQLVSFTRDFDLGRGLALTAASAAVIGLLAAGATRVRSAGLLAIASVLTLIPTALGGHASTSSGHETAVTSLGLHLLGASIWAGGLAALLLLGPGLSASASAVAVRRYSSLAVWCFGAVAVSGLINAWLRIGGLDGLATEYGLLLIAKAVTLLVLGGAGYWHRQHTLPELDAGRRFAFARLGVVELAVMALAFGLGAALSRTPPPATGQRTTDLAESITGYRMPAAPTASSWVTAWHPDLLWLIIAGLAAAGYLLAVYRLRLRGDRWPLLRTVPWLLGLLMLTYVTSGPPAVYGRVLFSAHMVMHMLLTMGVPPLLVLGAPVTLALRALPARRDGSRGAREWILGALNARVLQVLAFPPVAATLFAGSLIAFYYSDLFDLALTTHVGHELMAVHFLLTGYLFAWVLIGIDPGPRRLGYPLRLMMLFITMAFHAFFFLSIMGGSSVLQPEFFGGIGRTWGRGLLADQQYGGGIGWGIGEVPTLLIALVLVGQWSTADDRDAKRYDRAADRDGDAELEAYNAMLAKLSGRSRS
jgi:cytochrome c oxidase assembly factor CtaG/putative copper export protein